MRHAFPCSGPAVLPARAVRRHHCTHGRCDRHHAKLVTVRSDVHGPLTCSARRTSPRAEQAPAARVESRGMLCHHDAARLCNATNQHPAARLLELDLLAPLGEVVRRADDLALAVADEPLLRADGAREFAIVRDDDDAAVVRLDRLRAPVRITRARRGLGSGAATPEPTSLSVPLAIRRRQTRSATLFAESR